MSVATEKPEPTISVEAEAFQARVMRAVISEEARRLYAIGKELKKTGRAATGDAIGECAFRLDDLASDMVTKGMWELAQEVGEENALEQIVKRERRFDRPEDELTIAEIVAERSRLDEEMEQSDDVPAGREALDFLRAIEGRRSELTWKVLGLIEKGRIDPIAAAEALRGTREMS